MMSSLEAKDEALLRRAFALATAAGKSGELPFGAVIAGPGGGVIVESTSTEITTADWTCHAEMNAIRQACLRASRADLMAATLYASSECCVMCATAAFYAGIRRIIFGYPEHALRKLLASDETTTGLGFTCREILSAAPHPTTIIGPCLEDEAAAVHASFW